MLQCWKFILCFKSDLNRETLLSDNKPLKGYILILNELRDCLESSMPLITDKKVAIAFFSVRPKEIDFPGNIVIWKLKALVYSPLRVQDQHLSFFLPI